MGSRASSATSPTSSLTTRLADAARGTKLWQWQGRRGVNVCSHDHRGADEDVRALGHAGDETAHQSFGSRTCHFAVPAEKLPELNNNFETNWENGSCAACCTSSWKRPPRPTQKQNTHQTTYYMKDICTLCIKSPIVVNETEHHYYWLLNEKTNKGKKEIIYCTCFMYHQLSRQNHCWPNLYAPFF